MSAGAAVAVQQLPALLCHFDPLTGEVCISSEQPKDEAIAARNPSGKGALLPEGQRAITCNLTYRRRMMLGASAGVRSLGQH